MVQLVKRKHVLVLPESVDLTRPDAPRHRFLRLPHPRTRRPTLFLPVPSESCAGSSAARDALLEVQRIQPDVDKQRSWFIDQDVISDGSLGLLTHFDPIFLVISLLSGLSNHFVQYSELWEMAAQTVASRVIKSGSDTPGVDVEAEGAMIAEDVVRLGQMDCVRKRVETVCDIKEYDGLSLYRMTTDNIIKALKTKVNRLLDPVEGIFGPLERTDLNRTSDEAGPAGDKIASAQEGSERREVRYPTATRVLNKDGVGDGQGMSEQIQIESRTKTAIGVVSNYLPPNVTETLLGEYDFSALEAQLATIATSSVLSSTYLPGRGPSSSSGSLGGGAAAAAAKKKKQAAVKGSRGVEALKKVSTANMQKLSSYFTRQSPRKRKAP